MRQRTYLLEITRACETSSNNELLKSTIPFLFKVYW